MKLFCKLTKNFNKLLNMNTKNYKIKLTVTDPDTDKHLSASMDLNLIQDIRAMNGISALDEILQALLYEFEDATDTEFKIKNIGPDKALKMNKAFDELKARHPDKNSEEYKNGVADILKML